MPHLSVEHREEPEEEVESDHVWEVECKVPLVGQLDGELLSLLEVGNVPESDDSLADESQWIQRHPQRVPDVTIHNIILTADISLNFHFNSPQPGDESNVHVINPEQIIWVADYLND